IKQEEGDTVSETSGLNAKLISVPSRFSRVRDTGIGWTIQVNNFSPISSNITKFGTQNYNIYCDNTSNSFELFKYDIAEIGIDSVRRYSLIDYNSLLSLGYETNYSDSNFEYYAQILFDGSN